MRRERPTSSSTSPTSAVLAKLLLLRQDLLLLLLQQHLLVTLLRSSVPSNSHPGSAVRLLVPSSSPSRCSRTSVRARLLLHRSLLLHHPSEHVHPCCSSTVQLLRLRGSHTPSSSHAWWDGCPASLLVLGLDDLLKALGLLLVRVELLLGRRLAGILVRWGRRQVRSRRGRLLLLRLSHVRVGGGLRAAERVEEMLGGRGRGWSVGRGWREGVKGVLLLVRVQG